ncbi:hypothetical protein [Natronobacterium texcoconense]|uniref:Uncharacterized protein n=1 Tax=Natronobacterium texcoconense TaxID=1095778 RepID=A0A1H1CGV1_NATTX|nr:hypothetical protein [Natronobacterium texcoconense]SDQ63362.1 hypothetical protein SAMN04489842_1399 [Natronobacterium texcoconense]
MAQKDGSPRSPREGLHGAWDRLVGPGATRAENWLVVGYSVLFCSGLVLYVHLVPLEWNALQQLVAVLIAFDVAGGIVANTTESGRRWWHRPSQTRGDHVRFVAYHVHPFVLALLFGGFTLLEAGLVYGVLIASTVTVLAAPNELRRPVAMVLFSAGLIVALYLVSPPHGLEWFVPFLFLKLIPGHLVNDDRAR